MDVFCHCSRDDPPPDFFEFAEKVMFFGALNSLALLVLKSTCPGVPDFYQGSELWDFRLVDPDNRGPVNFEERKALLSGLTTASYSELLGSWRDGRVKLWVMQRLLRARGRSAALREGAYRSLAVLGPRAKDVVAFSRGEGASMVVVAVGLHTARWWPQGTFCRNDRVPLNEAGALRLPPGAPRRWRELFSGRQLRFSKKLSLDEAFRDAPFSVWVADRF